MGGALADVDGYPLPPNLERIISSCPTELLDCVELIAGAGGGAWLVGGAVRQGMLGVMPKDWDLAVDLNPEEMMKIFPDALETGIKFGTVTLRRGDFFFEATTLRGEGRYGDGRRPDSVEYSKSLAADLARRDFTFNAMAVDLSRQILHDPFEGRFDLEARKLRAVGDAAHRLGEDGLRIMRAYRFLDLGQGVHCQPDFALEQALVSHQYMLDNVARERIWSEFRLILAGNESAHILRRMAADGLLARILPSRWLSKDVGITAQFHHCLQGIVSEARLALLLVDADFTGIEEGLRKLKLSNEQIKTTLEHRRWLGTIPLDSPEGVLRRYRAVIGEMMPEQLRIERALAGEVSDNIDSIYDDFENRLRMLPKLRGGEKPLLDGLKLMEISGLPQGRRLGRLKDWLFRLQIERDLSDGGEVESLICTLSWQHGDENSWPRLAWP